MATSDPLIGREVHGYHVVECVGVGGMGRVYRAVQRAINAEVAIKVLAADAAEEPDLAERFVAEARTANLIRDEGFVKVLALGTLPDGRPYHVMEHLTGESLAEVVARGPLAPPAACAIVAELARALGVLHAAGVVHRDLKPANIFLATPGIPKILDFGIAKARSLGVELTRTGHVLGTPGYMAPEQALGQPVDERADLYALGVILFELVAGHRPFDGPAQLAALAEPRPPPALGSPSLDAVIAQAMAHDRTTRHADARALEVAVRALAGELPVLPPRASPPPTDSPRSTTAMLAATVGAPVPRRRVPGETVGKYRLVRPLGAGATGDVYLAVDPDADREVALKLLRRGDDARLLAEARALARVAHPNVVTLYEVSDADVPLLVMEYVEGGDLAAWLAAEARPWSAIVDVFAAAGDGLAAAHAAGVIHRDFKPANVLLGGDGRPRVGDFGLASRDGADATGGTPAYMAPEQVVRGPVDARVDQYAFCAALWHALHGELPFAGATSHAIALAAMRGERRAPRAPGVPGAVTRVLARGLAGSPAERYPALPALLAELRRAARRPRRWPWLAGASTIAAALAVVVVANRSPSAGVDHVAAAQAATDPATRLAHLARATDAELRTPAAGALALDAALRGPVRRLEEPGPITALALSDDGRRLAVAVAGEIRVHTAAGIERFPVDEGISRLVFREARIVAVGERRVFELVPGARPSPPGSRNCAGLARPVVSLDATRVACAVDDGIRILDAITDAPVMDIADASGLTFSPDARRAAVMRPTGEVAVYDLERRALIGTRALPPGYVVGDRALAYPRGAAIEIWDPAGETVAPRVFGPIASLTADRDGDITVISADGALDRWGATGWTKVKGTDVTAVRVLPGKRIALIGRKVLDVLDLATLRRFTLGASVTEVVAAADGSVIAAASGTTVSLWYPGLAAPLVVPFGTAAPRYAVSRAGRWLALQEGELVVRDLERGAAVAWSAPVAPVALAFAGERALVFALADGSVRERTLVDGRETVLGEVPAAVALVASDSAVLALGRDHRLWRVGAVPVIACAGLRVTSLETAWAIGETTDGALGRCELATERVTAVATTPSTLANLAVTRFGAPLARDGAGALQLLADPGLIPPRATDLDEITPGRFLVRTPDGLSIVARDAAARPLAESAGAMMFTRLGTSVVALANRRLLVWDLERPATPTWYGDFDFVSGLVIAPRYVLARAATHFVLIPRAAPDPATIRTWASRVR